MSNSPGSAWSDGWSDGYGPIALQPLIVDKIFLAHIYDWQTDSFLGVWDDLVEQPKFSWPINGGPGGMTLTRVIDWGMAGEDGDYSGVGWLELRNLVKIYVVDKEAPLGQLIYQGRIADYTYNLESRTVSVTLVPKTSLTQDRVIGSGSNETFILNDDPAEMVKYLIDNGYMPGIVYDTAGSADVGITILQEFSRMKVGQGLEIIQELAGGHWFYRFNPDDTLTFNRWDIRTVPAHDLMVGLHLSSNINFKKTNMETKYRVLVFGTNVNAEAADIGYDPEDEPRDLFIVNPRITDYDTAQRLAHSLLEFYRQPLFESVVEVMDNHGPQGNLIGYDIESLKPGQTLRIRNPDGSFYFNIWGDGHIYGDGSIWGGRWFEQITKPLVIANVDYRYRSAVLTLRSRPTSVPEELVGVSDRLLLQGS